MTRRTIVFPKICHDSLAMYGTNLLLYPTGALSSERRRSLGSAGGEKRHRKFHYYQPGSRRDTNEPITENSTQSVRGTETWWNNRRKPNRIPPVDQL